MRMLARRSERIVSACAAYQAGLTNGILSPLPANASLKDALS